MSYGSNPTTTTQTALGTNQLPVSTVYTPNTAAGNLTPLEGGPVTTDSNSNKSAPISTYTKDGSNVTIGTTTDTAYSGSGAGTEIAILKKIVAQLAASLAVSGTVTANAGTNLNTSALALETGGNLASIKADADSILSGIGAISDAAYSGSGSGSEIAILKKIVAQLAATISTSIASALPAGTNVIGHVIADSGSTTAVTSLPALPSGSNLIGNVELVDGAGTNKATISAGGALKVDGSSVTQPVSASSLPLPTGAATAAKQPALGTAGTPSSDVLSVQGIASMTALKVDGSAVTQPVSGTVIVQQSTASNLKVDLSGTSANATALKVDGSAVTQPVSGTVSDQHSNVLIDYDSGAGTQNMTVFGIALPASGGSVAGGTTSNPLKVDPTGTTTQPVSATSLPLPTGASTSAKQPALGTAGSASSDVITVQGIASMTALKVDGSAVTQPVSGTVTVTQATAANLKVDLSGTSANATALKVDGSAVTQPVSGTVTANAGTGTFTVSDQHSNNTTDYDTGAGTQTMTMYGLALPASGGSVPGGTATNPVRVDTTGTTTQPVSAASLPLPTGASTSAKQPALGTAGSASSDVLTVQGIASMTALKVDGSAVTQPVSGTITVTQSTASNLKVDLSGTSANATALNVADQHTNITTDYDSGAGTQTMTMYGLALPASGGSVAGGTSANPIKTDPTGTTTQPVSATSLPLPTGAATSAKQPALGTAGSSSTDVLSIQGIASGTPIPITGSITATNPSVSTDGSAIPTSSTLIGASDGTNLQQLLVESASNRNLRVGIYGGATEASVTGSNALKVDGSAVTQPVSAASLPLPTGASTSAKQPALGTAGTASTDVLSVQGIASMTALKVDGSAVTQPVSGTVTVTQSTAANLKVDLSGTAANATALKVDGSAVTQPVSGTITANAGSGTFTVSDQHSNNTTDYDTGAGTQTMTMYGIALPATGGSVAGGTATNPVRTDPTGTTAQPVSGTVAATQSGTWTVQPGNTANTTAWKVDGSAVTQPVSGTVTSNIGTTNGLALDTSINGVIVSQASTTSGEKGPLIQGAVTTASPTYTTAQTNPLSLTTAGALRVDASATTQPVSGTVTANAGTNMSTAALALETGGNLATLAGAVTSAKVQSNVAQINGVAPLMGNGVSGTGAQRVTIASDSTGQIALAAGSAVIGHVIADSGSTTAVTQATASSLNAQVVGAVASAGSNAGNPLKVGGAFNSTQPTVTNAQIVDAQMTARGAQIVATGVDTFSATVSGTVTANAGTNLNTSALALETGGNLATLAGAISSTKMQSNLAQVNGSTTVTAATGVQKVGIVGNTGATVDSGVGAGTAPTNAVVGGLVYNSASPAPTSGQSMAMQADQAGNIRVFQGVSFATLAAWNSSTTINTVQNIFTNSGAESVIVQLTQTTTITVGAITFEVTYDNTSNWQTIPANAVFDPTSTTFAAISLPYTLQASTNKIIGLNMNGATGLRIKLSTAITGSGSVTPFYALQPYSPADTIIALSPTAANFLTSTNINQISGTSAGVANPLYVSQSANTGYVSAFGSNASALTANTDAAFKWGAGGTTVVNHIMLQNNTALNVLFDLDVATNAGSPICSPGQTLFFDVQTTALHLQANGTPNLNGSGAANIVIRAWL